MSDLVATNCGGGCGCERPSCGCERPSCGCERHSGCGSNNIIWILLILAFCGGGSCGNSWGFGGGDNDCCSIIWILLILSCCGGGGSFFGGGCGC